MYFYVDESGHTGPNLFDINQPFLYYGVLSSYLNIDILGEKYIHRLRRETEVKRLHAAELGNSGLLVTLPILKEIQQKFKIRFDCYRISKLDLALICFFDQVFDQSVNQAVPWTAYWTPLRYILLLKLSVIFDEVLLKKAWIARIERNRDNAKESLVEICAELKRRVHNLPDIRSQQLIINALEWAENNPDKIQYNTESKRELIFVTPNIIAFQQVMFGIALRIKKHKAKRSKVIVDQQSQFNKSQQHLSELYVSAKEKMPYFKTGTGLPAIDFRGMPSGPITFKSSCESFGLELVDIYLWIFKRFLEKKTLADELLYIVHSNMNKTMFDEVSLNAIAERWSKWFEEISEQTEQL